MGDRERVVPWMLLAEVAAQRGDRSKAIGFARRVLAATQDGDPGSLGEARARMQTLLRGWRVVAP
jgi:hypothetical protein